MREFKNHRIRTATTDVDSDSLVLLLNKGWSVAHTFESHGGVNVILTRRRSFLGHGVRRALGLVRPGSFAIKRNV